MWSYAIRCMTSRKLTRFYMGAAGQVLNKGGEKKHVLREAMRGTLPELVRTRTTKTPLRGPSIIDACTALLRQRAPEDLLCVKLGWVDGAEIRRIHAAQERWREDGLPNPPPDEPGNAVLVRPGHGHVARASPSKF